MGWGFKPVKCVMTAADVLRNGRGTLSAKAGMGGGVTGTAAVCKSGGSSQEKSF